MGNTFTESDKEAKRAAYKVAKGDNDTARVDIDGRMYTPQELSAMILQKMKKTAKNLTKDKVQLENKINPDIIGGFILQIGDMQYDASVVHQLKAIKTTLTKTNTI